MKTHSRAISSAGVAVIFGAMFPAASALAALTTYDLTATGSSAGPLNGATFYQSSAQPTGTGYINPFLRLQATGTEEGLNTDASPVPFNDKPGIWTHALLFSNISQNAAGQLTFFLDVNQIGSGTYPNNLISLDQLKLFRSDSATLTTLPGSFLYDLDAGGDKSITLDFLHGSGSGDMYFTIAASALAGTGKYLYLYSQFGTQFPSNDGFEEWSTFTATAPIPEPGTYAMMFAGLGVIGFMARRRQRQA